MAEIINLNGNIDQAQVAAINAICAKARELGDLIQDNCPEGWGTENSLMFLQTALHWANFALLEDDE